MTSLLATHANYQDRLNSIKQHLQSARLRAALVVNHELIRFYWILAAASSPFSQQFVVQTPWVALLTVEEIEVDQQQLQESVVA